MIEAVYISWGIGLSCASNTNSVWQRYRYQKLYWPINPMGIALPIIGNPEWPPARRIGKSYSIYLLVTWQKGIVY
jgi:hypothetical protein